MNEKADGRWEGQIENRVSNLEKQMPKGDAANAARIDRLYTLVWTILSAFAMVGAKSLGFWP